MEITRVAVIGAGTMGRGIAQVAALAGFPVTLIDRDQHILDDAVEAIRASLARAVERGEFSEEDADVAASLIGADLDLDAAADSSLVIESINEDPAAKRDLLARLDELCPAEAIFASNTSSISITSLAAATERPAAVVGLHFFNPVPAMKLVEVVRGLLTSDETHRAVVRFVEALGKTPVTVADSPGFVSNRVLLPMINEAAFCLMEGIASAEEIDTVMRLGMNHPMGPLALADLIGLDVCLDILEVLQRELGEPKYRPCPLLRKLVAAGRLGRKSGEGFFRYA